MPGCELTFWVSGTPIPQGSHRAPRAGVVLDQQNRKTKRRKAGGLDTWRSAVYVMARKAAIADGWSHRAGPVGLLLHFKLRRGRSVDRRAPSVKPDLDKLCRAICDALTGALYDDDAQICALLSTKTYADQDAEPGVMITVRGIA